LKNAKKPTASSPPPSTPDANPKQADIAPQVALPGDRLTTNQGLRVVDDQNQLKAGVRGPSLLEDFHFREKITHFDHERIPERVVHARGAAAHGCFESSGSAADLTKASLFAAKGKQTPVFVRFSTVVGSRGSADTARDVRGFSIKFYTDEGVWDLVGNNIPVFFIQDAIKFPDLIHAAKPEPHNEIPQAATAHDTFWDFVSLTPESTHMLLWVMSDRALPRSFAMMEGFGIHTFRMINAGGQSSFVKFHFKPAKGVHSLVWDEAQKLAGKDADFNRRDLSAAIERRDYPEWEMGVQVVAEADERKFDFDLLDPTKIIPEELVPIRKIGKLILNRNPDNYFAETEQVAFHPGHVVPGIDFSNDPLLQGRLFSYFDTQIKRVGPNFAQIPINRPACPMSNNQRDGESQQLIHKGRVSYFPNSLGNGCPAHSPDGMKAFSSFVEKMEGGKVRERSPSFADHFSQATLFWNSMADWEKSHIVSAFSFELNMVDTEAVRERVVNELLINVALELAQRVSRQTGIKLMAKPRTKAHHRSSPALSMNKPCTNIKGRKIAILAGSGVDGAVVNALLKRLAAEGAAGEIIAKSRGTIAAADGSEFVVDKAVPNAPSVAYDAVFIPGGNSVAELMALPPVIAFVSEMHCHGKPIAAAADAAALLAAAQVPPTEGETDGIVRGKEAGSSDKALIDGLLASLLQHRFPGRQPETTSV